MEQKNTRLHEKISTLTDEVNRLHGENTKLRQLVDEIPSGHQASQLHDRNRALEEENLKLKTELKNLRSSLSMLVSSTSVDASQSGTKHT